MTYSFVAHADNQRSFNDGYHVQVEDRSRSPQNSLSVASSIRSSHARRPQDRSASNVNLLRAE
jgi:hypothetical protein